MSHPTLRNRSTALPVLASLLVCLALCSVIVLDHLKYVAVRFVEANRSMSELPGYLLSTLHPFHYVLVLVTAVLFLLAAFYEVRQRAISNALAELTNRQWMWLSVAVIAWAIHAYIIPGRLIVGDASSHISRVAHFGEALRSGKAIFWDNYFYLGAPLLQFTGPLYFWIAAGVDALFKDATFSTKLFLAVLHALSLVTFYRFVRMLGVARLAAGVGSFIYGCAFAHQALIHWRGAYPQAITLALMPLTCELAMRVILSPRIFSASAAGLALCVAAQMLNHQASGFVAILFTIPLLLVELLNNRDWLRAIPPFVIAGIAAVLISLVGVIPIFQERAFVMMYEEMHLLAFRLPDLDYFKHLLLWRITNPKMGSHSVAYVGITSVLLGVVAVIAAVRGTLDRSLRASTLIAAGSLVLSFFVYAAHVRDIMYTLFFVALLASLGMMVVQSFVSSRTLMIVLILLFADVGTAAIQPNARTDKEFFQTAAHTLEQTADYANRRILMVSSRGKNLSVSIGPGGTMMDARVQQLTGAHNLTAPLTHNYGATIIKKVERDLRAQNSLRPETEKLLAMLNTTALIGEQGTRMGLPDSISGAIEEPALGRVLRVKHPTPILFANRLTVMNPPTPLDKPLLWNEDFTSQSSQIVETEKFVDAVTTKMNIQPDTNSAATITVRTEITGPPINEANEAVVKDAAWHVALKDYRVTVDEVVLRVESSEAGYAQLAHPWYPFLRVEQDGKQITPWRSSLNLLVVPVHTGINEYRLVPTRTPIRMQLGWLSLAVSVVLVGVCLFARQKV